MGSPKSTIRVERDQVGYNDRFRSYKVLVDGHERTSVGRGDSATIEVEPGPHTVAMKIDWCGSPTVSVDLLPGGEHRLRCRPNGNPVTGLYYMVAARRRYIALWSA